MTRRRRSRRTISPTPPRIFVRYYEVIAQPIDLETIESKLKGGAYAPPPQPSDAARAASVRARFVDDVRLLWRNCQMFNDPSSLIYVDSQTLQSALHYISFYFISFHLRQLADAAKCVARAPSSPTPLPDSLSQPPPFRAARLHRFVATAIDRVCSCTAVAACWRRRRRKSRRGRVVVVERGRETPARGPFALAVAGQSGGPARAAWRDGLGRTAPLLVVVATFAEFAEDKLAALVPGFTVR